MTSAISSSTHNPPSGAGFFVRQRELAGHRLWPIALTFLSLLLYNVVGTATALLLIRQNSLTFHPGRDRMMENLRETAISILGSDSLSWALIVFPLSMILAIEAFAWMDNRQEVDFYESQPVSRKTRFLDLCAGSFLYFLFSYAITLAAGLLITGAMGVLTRPVLMDVLGYAAKTVAFFAAVHGLAVLSVMLTGNVIVACLAFFVLSVYEVAIKALLTGYCSEFLTTWQESGAFWQSAVFSPFTHFQCGTKEAVLKLAGLAILFFLLAWIAYRLRKNEYAGTAVVFRPVRMIVRIAIALFVGLSAGLLVTSFSPRAGLVAALLWMVLFTVIAACIMQIIYDYDFRALFRKPLEIVLACALTLLIYLGFLFDVTGYDRFIPVPDQVRDASLSLANGYYDPLYDDLGRPIDPQTYASQYMHLEKIDDVTALAEYGQQYTRAADAKYLLAGPEKASPEQVEAAAPGLNFVVLYRMKNGRTISRRFRLPNDIDPARLDAIFTTSQYREGTFNIYHDAAVRAFPDRFTLTYTNGADTSQVLRLDASNYAAFREAYIRDLSLYSYSLAYNDPPVGRVSLSFDGRTQALDSAVLADPSVRETADNLKLSSMYVPYSIYPSYENTIAFLKENGVWINSLDIDSLPSWDDEDLSPGDKRLLESLDPSVLNDPLYKKNNWY